MTDTTTTPIGWAILELMGHRRLAGYLIEEVVAGQGMLRLEIPEAGAAPPTTQYYSASAVYCITPTSEEVARAVAVGERPSPVNRWELPAAEEREPVDAELAELEDGF